ncbi:MAG: glycoside hydrolase family 65 protein [Chloroflexota bacterium]|nr:glycoside hydrolase family 65 protein [Chloroflexota bacterium]
MKHLPMSPSETERTLTGWVLAWDQFEPEQEGKREALCTLGNGYLASRGAAPESRVDSTHYPGTYVSGLYNRLSAEADGTPVEFESIVQIPNWLPLRWRIEGGEWIDLKAVTILTFRQELELRRGVLSRSIRIEDGHGRRMQLTDRRFVHLVEPHLAALEMTIAAENWSGRIEVESEIDGGVRHTLVIDDQELAGRHITVLDFGEGEGDTIWLRARTVRSRIDIDVATRLRIAIDGERRQPGMQVTSGDDRIRQAFSLDVPQGQKVSIEKIAAVVTGCDRAMSETGLAARRAVSRAAAFDGELERHVVAWEHLWRRCPLDLELEPDVDGEAQGIVRLHLFHLLGTLSPHLWDRDVGVPARGWTEAYRGHIFWDELFVLPYFHLHLPEVSRALLLYRYRRLDEARASAREAGYRGAMFPWRSGSDGREVTPAVYFNPRNEGWIDDHTYLQRHIGSAIASNVWQYLEVTGDREFLSDHGAEMLLEIARFWSSIATFSEEHERYEIHGVMGPDEFHTGYPWADHPGLSNNTYTNVMAIWVVCRAREALDRLPAWRGAELREQLGLDDAELARWDDISRRMRVVYGDDGILAQFEGFDRLEELDQDAYRERYGDISRIDYILDAESDTPNRYTMAKQPDVTMLFYVLPPAELRSLFERLGYPFDDGTVQRNVEYYGQRSTHGSTLSRVVEAEIAARVDRGNSWPRLSEALRSDVGSDGDGSTAEGVHLGAMAGTVNLIERCYTGFEASGDVVRFAPELPAEVRFLSSRLRYRGCWLDVTVTPDRIRIGTASDAPEDVTVACGERCETLTPGASVDWPY